MPKYVVDTNLYVRATRDDAGSQALETFFLGFTPHVYLHSVVALEIIAGATNADLAERTEARFIQPFERRDRIVTPSHSAWKRAAQGLARLVRERRVSSGPGISRSFVNDCLIAASARDLGFVLVTENTSDFQLIDTVLPLDFVPPWPAPAP